MSAVQLNMSSQCITSWLLIRNPISQPNIEYLLFPTLVLSTILTSHSHSSDCTHWQLSLTAPLPVLQLLSQVLPVCMAAAGAAY